MIITFSDIFGHTLVVAYVLSRIANVLVPRIGSCERCVPMLLRVLHTGIYQVADSMSKTH